jgi:hypothetical protein
MRRERFVASTSRRIPTRAVRRRGCDRVEWRPPRLSASSAVARTERPGDTAGEAALGSAELFGERDDDAIGAAEVAEPIEILVLRHLADELGAVSPHAGNDVVDVVDGEHDAT